jgi:5-(carboxyamino)imidazole ribonucleotide synthase
LSGAILPGATLGVLGGGQLGRMFAIAARRMGYRVHTFSPEDDTPAGQVSDREVRAPYDDLDAVRAFARDVDVVTFEFENVPAPTAAAAAEEAPVRPAGKVLHITQNRLREKGFLAAAGFPVTPHRAVRSLTELRDGLAALGGAGVLKTAGWGYDGKGQVRLEAADLLSGHGEAVDRLGAAWGAMGAAEEAVLEQLVDFAAEVSVVAARGADGSFAHFGLIENQHRNHILDVSMAPSPLAAREAGLEGRAIALARGVLEALDVVGVLCVELFVTASGELLINELAPRPHNSGHLTFDACVSSQFEQQVRAICGLPLGGTELLRPAAMANLLGDLWRRGEPDWLAACAFPEVKLHLYGKAEARPGRKMGHLTAFAGDAPAARQLALAARQALTQESPE